MCILFLAGSHFLILILFSPLCSSFLLSYTCLLSSSTFALTSSFFSVTWALAELKSELRELEGFAAAGAVRADSWSWGRTRVPGMA